MYFLKPRTLISLFPNLNYLATQSLILAVFDDCFFRNESCTLSYLSKYIFIVK